MLIQRKSADTAYQVEYQEKPGYLYVTVLGERSLEAVIKLLHEVIEKAIELHYQRLLIDVRDFSGRLRPMESYDIVNGEFWKFRGKGLQRVAIVDRELPEEKQWSFFETLARNRGFNLTIYTDFKPASVWLVEGLDIEPEGK